MTFQFAGFDPLTVLGYFVFLFHIILHFTCFRY